MRGKKKLILLIFMMIFTFVFNMNSVLGWYKASTKASSNLTQNGDEYALSCGNVTTYFKVLEVKDNNESKNDCLDENGNQAAGTIWTQDNSKRIKKLTEKISKDGNTHYILWAHSVTNGTTKSISLSINNNTTGQQCSGKIDIVPTTPGDYRAKNSSVKFELKVESKSETTEKFSSTVSFEVVSYKLVIKKFKKIPQGTLLGNYKLIFEGTTEAIAKQATECSDGNEQSCENFKAEQKEKQTVEGDYSNYNKKTIASTTQPISFETGETEKLECDETLSSFIREIWKYIIIFAPMLLIVMITMDFFKALFSSDSELIKKASSNAVKRVVATVILLFLPLIISTILDFFGLEFCFWGGK